jgi:single-strand DNA-binding protein
VKDISKPERRFDMSSKSINLVFLIGHLGAAPEIGESKNGVAYAKFSMATNNSWKDARGDRQERTDWHRVVAFNGLAKTLAQLGTGDKVGVQGRLKTDSYEKDGVRHTSVEIVANQIQFLVLKGRDVAPAESVEDDDIPY